MDADGIHETKWRRTGQGVVIEDTRSRAAIYLATPSPTVRAELEQRRQSALAVEAANPIEREALELLQKWTACERPSTRRSKLGYAQHRLQRPGGNLK